MLTLEETAGLWFAIRNIKPDPKEDWIYPIGKMRRNVRPHTVYVDFHFCRHGETIVEGIGEHDQVMEWFALLVKAEKAKQK